MSLRRSYEYNNQTRLTQLIQEEITSVASGIQARNISADRKLESTLSLTSDPDPEEPDSINSILPTSLKTLYLKNSKVPIGRLPGIGIFYSTTSPRHFRAPYAFSHFLTHFPALHSTCVFLHVQTVAQPRVPMSKLLLKRLPWEGFWHGLYTVGYMETPDFETHNFQASLIQQLGCTQRQEITFISQYTALQGKRLEELEGAGWFTLIMRGCSIARAWFIDVLWTGIDEAVGNRERFWAIPSDTSFGVRVVAKV
jgi:K+ potassium transporter